MAISSGKVISINTGKVITPGGAVVGTAQSQQISSKVPVRTVGQGRVIGGTPPHQRILAGSHTHSITSSTAGGITSQTITTTTGKSGQYYYYCRIYIYISVVSALRLIIRGVLSVPAIKQSSLVP